MGFKIFFLYKSDLKSHLISKQKSLVYSRISV